MKKFKGFFKKQNVTEAVVEEKALLEDKSDKLLPDYVVLKEIDLKIKQGEFVTIIGDVGSGKSSLMNAIIGDMLYFDQLEAERLEENSQGESFKSKVWKAQGLIEKNKGKRRGVVGLT